MSIIIYLDMDQCVCVPASVYKEILTKDTFMKQFFPLYQIQKNLTNPTLLIGSLETETNKKVLARAGSLVDKILYYPYVVLQKFQSFFLVGV